MKHYDPEIPPVTAEWLELDEEHRIRLAESYHRATGEKFPNGTVHAIMHAIIENQTAEGLEPVVRAMPRLVMQGLSRHEAVHAIASVLGEHFYEVMKTKDIDLAATAQERYLADVERLTAEEWFRKYE